MKTIFKNTVLVFLVTIMTLLTAISTAQTPFLVDEEYTQFSIWNDPVSTFKNNDTQVGIEMTKVMYGGWISASMSVADLEASYTDFVGSGGINFHLFNYDPVRYYAGPRLGIMIRETKGFGLFGGVIGFDWRLTRKGSDTNIHIGSRLWLDYREDQKNQFFGDSSAYERGIITNNPLLQENGGIVVSFSWD